MESRTATFAFGATVALAFAAGWVALTAATGATYHLAPPIVAAAPGVVAWAGGGGRSPVESVVLAVIGLLVAVLGWAVILATGNEPNATIVKDLPGGVWGEVVVGALLGALAGAWQARRAAPAPR
jgi:hypothetical protein